MVAEKNAALSVIFSLYIIYIYIYIYLYIYTLFYWDDLYWEYKCMYNRTGLRWLESKYSAVGEEKALFSTIAKPELFGLGMVLKENFLACSTQLIFLIIRNLITL